MNFFKIFFASLLALIIFTVLGILIVIGMASSLAEEKEVVVEENSVLHLKLDGPVSELQKENPLAGLPIIGSDAQNVGLIQLKQSIEHAKTDAKIKGIYLEVSHPQAGYS